MSLIDVIPLAPYSMRFGQSVLVFCWHWHFYFSILYCKGVFLHFSHVSTYMYSLARRLDIMWRVAFAFCRKDSFICFVARKMVFYAFSHWKQFPFKSREVAIIQCWALTHVDITRVVVYGGRGMEPMSWLAPCTEVSVPNILARIVSCGRGNIIRCQAKSTWLAGRTSDLWGIISLVLEKDHFFEQTCCDSLCFLCIDPLCMWISQCLSKSALKRYKKTRRFEGAPSSSVF